MTDTFDWGQLTEDWSKETAVKCGATLAHAKFAARKHAGATNTDAARAAGYGNGKPTCERSEGYRVSRSNKVMQMLALAAIEAGGGYDGTLTRTESRQILTGLARGSDPSIKIKAIESVHKLDDQDRRDGEHPDDDGLGPFRMQRDMISLPGGGCALLYLVGGQLNNLSLFHDTYAVVHAEPWGVEIWDRFYENLNAPARAEVDKYMAEPGWQLDVRRKLWAEVGRTPPAPISSNAVDFLNKPEGAPSAAA
jgi:hypothetical protein